jgi:FkbM family methyltransferase
VRRLLRQLGIDVVAYAPRNYPHLRRRLLLQELEIELVVDGGASDGVWAAALREGGYGRRIVSVEPEAESYARLELRARDDPLWSCHRAALGARTDKGVLHVARNRQSSSLLPMLDRHLDLEPRSGYVANEEVELVRLDDLVGATQERVFLKLDLQGAELDALRGAEETLTATRAVELELSAVPLYEGQALLPDVLSLLYSRGFELIGLETSFRDRATGDLLQANGFLRRR